MIELNIWQLLVGFVAAMGIPSAIMGLIVKRLEKRLAKRDSMYFCYALGWVPAIAIAWGFYLTGRWKRKAVVPQKKQE